MNKYFALGALAIIGVAACNQDHSVTWDRRNRAVPHRSRRSATTSVDGPGAVYALTNQSDGNAVAIFTRAGRRDAQLDRHAATGGTGAGRVLAHRAHSHNDDGPVGLFAGERRLNDISAF